MVGARACIASCKCVVFVAPKLRTGQLVGSSKPAARGCFRWQKLPISYQKLLIRIRKLLQSSASEGGRVSFSEINCFKPASCLEEPLSELALGVLLTGLTDFARPVSALARSSGLFYWKSDISIL